MAAPFRQYSSIRWQTALAVCWDITLMVGVGQDISIPSASSNSYKGGAMLPLVLSVLNNGSRTEDRQTDRAWFCHFYYIWPLAGRLLGSVVVEACTGTAVDNVY